MNEHTLKGSVHELIGRAKRYWAKLTDEDLKDFDGKEELDEHFRRFDDEFRSESDRTKTRDRELQ